MKTGNDLVAEPLQYSSDFGHSFKMKISEISLYFNGLRFHLSILPKSNYLPLCCFTGLSYIDIKTLKASEICISFDGKPWIMRHRQKTDTPVNVPLLKIPLAILKKYEGQLPKGELLPVLSNQKLNSYLKEIADLCGINKNITFHLARHCTWSLSLNLNGLQRSAS
ncbi:site-specific integrase [Parabacteroides distasonis]|nr:site-specific integrase [Parabacteroides distasonis]